MSTFATLLSTDFAIAPGVAADYVSNLVLQHSHYMVKLQPEIHLPGADNPAPGTEPQRFALEIDADQGVALQSFTAMVEELVQSLGQLVSEPFSVTVREDSYNDDNERDKTFFGGPSPESIEAFKNERAYRTALQAFAGLNPDQQAKLQTELATGGPQADVAKLNDAIASLLGRLSDAGFSPMNGLGYDRFTKDVSGDQATAIDESIVNLVEVSGLKPMVIHSEQEGGYWSNQNGWVFPETATQFFTKPESMPSIGVPDCVLVPLESALADDDRQPEWRAPRG